MFNCQFESIMAIISLSTCDVDFFTADIANESDIARLSIYLYLLVSDMTPEYFASSDVFLCAFSL